MSIRFNGSGDNLAALLSGNLTIGTGDFSFGMWVKNISDRTTVEADFFLVGDAASSPSTYLYTYADFPGIFLFGSNNGGVLANGTGLSVGTWYYLVLSRVSGTLHIRVFDDTASTTPVVDGTAAVATSYTTLDAVILGAAINANRWPDMEAQAFKIHTGVSWTNAQARTESQFFAVQTGGGTNRLAYRLHNLAAGLTEIGGNTALTNTGCVDGASRPTQLEADPASGSTPSAATTRQPQRHEQRSRALSDVVPSSVISGTANITLADVTASATAQLIIQGTASITLGDVTPSATGTLKIQAASAITLADVTPASTGALIIQATASITLADVTFSATATVSQPDLGGPPTQQPVLPWLNRSRALSFDVPPSNVINGQANITVGDVTCGATGTLILKAASTITVADVTPSATGTLKIQAGASITLDPVTVSASGVGTASTSGTASITLGDVTVTAAGAVKIAASASISLGAVTIVATGGVKLQAAGAITLSPVTLTATATIGAPSNVTFALTLPLSTELDPSCRPRYTEIT